MSLVWIVKLEEFKCGWGSKVFAAHEFETEKEALVYQKEVNAENDSDIVPDYYIIAHDPYKAEKRVS